MNNIKTKIESAPNSIDALRAKREALQKEMEAVIAQEKTITEEKLRNACQALITEIRNLGLSGYSYEPDGETLTIKVGMRKTGKTATRIGGRISISKNGEVIGDYASYNEAAKALSCFKEGANNRLSLEANGYTTTKVVAIVSTPDK